MCPAPGPRRRRWVLSPIGRLVVVPLCPACVTRETFAVLSQAPACSRLSKPSTIGLYSRAKLFVVCTSSVGDVEVCYTAAISECGTHVCGARCLDSNGWINALTYSWQRVGKHQALMAFSLAHVYRQTIFGLLCLGSSGDRPSTYIRRAFRLSWLFLGYEFGYLGGCELSVSTLCRMPSEFFPA